MSLPLYSSTKQSQAQGGFKREQEQRNSCVHTEGVVDVFSAIEARTLQILGSPEMHDTVQSDSSDKTAMKTAHQS